MANTHETLTSLFTDIADAIRSKTGSEESIKADDFPSAIEGMEVGGGGAVVSGVTAGTDDVVEGKVFVDSEGNEKTGTIPEKDADDIGVSGATVNVPAGRYKEAASKAVSNGALSSPEISVNTSGVITATSKVSTAGYLSTSSSKSNTKTLSTQSGTTITPGTSKKTAVSSGRYTTGTVYVAGDTNLLAENIKSGISIFGVNGSYSGGGTTPVADETCTIVYDNDADIYCAYVSLTEFYKQCPDRGPASIMINTVNEAMEYAYADGIISFAAFSLTGADGSYITQSLGLKESRVTHASSKHAVSIVTYNGEPALKIVATTAKAYLAFNPDVSYVAVMYG